MKKISACSFLLLTVAFSTNAQVVNGDFENWEVVTQGAYTFDSLHFWKTTELFSLQNSGNTNHSVQQETSDVFQGSSAIRLTSWSTTGFVIDGLPGCASTGDVVVVPFPPSVTPVGGDTTTLRWASLQGRYKYIPAGSDSGSIEVCLFKWNGTSRDTVASGSFSPSLIINQYTEFTVNLTAVSQDNPDTSLIWIQSSPRSPIGSGVTGTVLKVDAINFSGLIGVNDVSPVVKTFLTYPVPAVNDINIKVVLSNPVSLNYEITDLNGKLIASDVMNGDSRKIDVSSLANGNYVISLRDDAGKALASHDFTVAR